MAGWIKVYRALADHWLAQDLQKLGWWIMLLLRVNHEDKKVLAGNQLIELKRGQIVASLTYLAELWKTSKRTAERFVELLEHDKMVSRCTRQRITILTICNYEDYQESKRSGCAEPCADDAPIGIRQVSETKKEKEGEEIYYNINNSAHTRTREDEYIARYRAEAMWADVAMILHLKSISECEHLFDRWILEFQHKGMTHPDYSNFKSHFIQWARIALQKENTNGNNNRTNQRRGVQVVANSVEDYEGAF